MNVLNLLNSAYKVVTVYNESDLGKVPLSGVAEFVAKVINLFSFGGSIAVGILLFSLLLKILPLPLDIYSRASAKKGALKMEKMRPQLEKLQRQYANNNALYQQKVMALYKREGYSQFAACLPTLITLIFFIVIINAFTQYSSYAKINTFNEMAIAYSNDIKVNKYVENRYYNILNDGSLQILEKGDTSGAYNGYFFDEEKYQSEGTFDTLVIKPAQDAAAERYFELNENTKFLWVKNIWVEDLPWKKAFISKEDYLNKTFTYSKGCSAKNINSSIKNEEAYDIIMGSSKLDEVKNQSNGYLILVLLSIASMFISQLIMSKSQKSQLELQSVDGANGTAAQTTKMMMWMMPLMFGVFSFMYTASFSLYLIVSTLFSTVSTYFINIFVEKSFQKKLQKEEDEKYNKRYGHITKK